MEVKFFTSVMYGNVSEVREILRLNPCLDVNWKSAKVNGWSALHLSCANGLPAIVSLLLAHPDIDVNLKEAYGCTPFYWACSNGRTSCVLLLLEESTIRVSEPSNGGYTPLSNVAHSGFLDIIRWWMVSGRDLDLGTPGNKDTDAVWRAGKVEKWHGETTQKDKRKIATLLEKFLEVNNNNREDNNPASRFFLMTGRLPLDLQMVMCHRLVSSSRDIILGLESEMAFRNLVKRMTH